MSTSNENSPKGKRAQSFHEPRATALKNRRLYPDLAFTRHLFSAGFLFRLVDFSFPLLVCFRFFYSKQRKGWGEVFLRETNPLCFSCSVQPWSLSITSLTHKQLAFSTVSDFFSSSNLQRMKQSGDVNSCNSTPKSESPLHCLQTHRIGEKNKRQKRVLASVLSAFFSVSAKISYR